MQTKYVQRMDFVSDYVICSSWRLQTNVCLQGLGNLFRRQCSFHWFNDMIFIITRLFKFANRISTIFQKNHQNHQITKKIEKSKTIQILHFSHIVSALRIHGGTGVRRAPPCRLLHAFTLARHPCHEMSYQFTSPRFFPFFSACLAIRKAVTLIPQPSVSHFREAVCKEERRHQFPLFTSILSFPALMVFRPSASLCFSTMVRRVADFPSQQTAIIRVPSLCASQSETDFGWAVPLEDAILTESFAIFL